MLACYFVQLKMASWIMVLSLGTFGPSEYTLIADGLVFFFFKERRSKAWKVESFFAFTVNLISKLNLVLSYLISFFFMTFSRLSLAPSRGLQDLGAGNGLPSVFLSKRQAFQVLPAMRIRKTHVVVPTVATTPRDRCRIN